MKDSCYKMMSLAYLLGLWFLLTAAQSQNENDNSGCQTYEVFLEQKTFLEGEDFKWKCSHTFSDGKPTDIGFYTRVTETDAWNDTVKFESGTVGYQSVPLDDLVVIGPGNNGCYEDGCQITMHANASMYLHWRCHVITDTCADGREATTQLIEPHIRYVKIIESNYILYRRLFLGTLCIFPLGTLYPSADNIERPKDVD